eukprot:6210954-Pleurochrysis_carterae.AAC.1
MERQAVKMFPTVIEQHKTCYGKYPNGQNTGIGHRINHLWLIPGLLTGSYYSPDAPVVYKSSNVHNYVSQSKIPGVRNEVVRRLSWDVSGALRCTASLYATSAKSNFCLTHALAA